MWLATVKLVANRLLERRHPCLPTLRNSNRFTGEQNL